jgi:VWFA-related protein
MGYGDQSASRSVNLEHTPEKSTAFQRASQHGGLCRVSGRNVTAEPAQTEEVLADHWQDQGVSVMRAARLSALLLFFPAVIPGFASAQQQSVPDAPAPAQTAPPNAPAPQAPSSLPDLKGQVAPGKGSSTDQQGAAPGSGPQGPGQQAPQTPPPPDAVQQTAPQIGGQVPTFRVGVTYVDVPVTVRDKHGKEISGLDWYRFKVFEDGVEQRIVFFSTSAYPLSIAFVVDATLPADIMQKVNQSFSVVSSGLTPSDSVAVISYAGTGPQMVTDFTAAGGPRLTAALQIAKKPGEQPGVPLVDDPFSRGPQVNGEAPDPTLTPQRGNSSPFLNMPRETHPLNDAILYAAEQLASQPKERRRVIYVISDGKNVRSKASYKEVVQYLLAHDISVNGTNVGDTALWGFGFLDRQKLPLLQPEDVLPRYAIATGGDVAHELSEDGIQRTFIHIADSVRTQYTLGYLSHQPTISGKYHTIDVHLEGLPGYEIDAKQGYYPTASMQ